MPAASAWHGRGEADQVCADRIGHVAAQMRLRNTPVALADMRHILARATDRAIALVPGTNGHRRQLWHRSRQDLPV